MKMRCYDIIALPWHPCIGRCIVFDASQAFREAVPTAMAVGSALESVVRSPSAPSPPLQTTTTYCNRVLQVYRTVAFFVDMREPCFVSCLFLRRAPPPHETVVEERQQAQEVGGQVFAQEALPERGPGYPEAGACAFLLPLSLYIPFFSPPRFYPPGSPALYI